MEAGEQIHPEELWEIDEAGPGRHLTGSWPGWKEAVQAVHTGQTPWDRREVLGEPHRWRAAVEPHIEEYRTRATRLAPLRDPDWLANQYWAEGKSLKTIGNELGCTAMTVLKAMRKWGIPRREPGRRAKEHEQIEPDPELVDRARRL